jgi:hypothetical protein
MRVLCSQINGISLPTANPPYMQARARSRQGEPQVRTQQGLPRWYGWHAFRRGLATNLNQLGVDDSVSKNLHRTWRGTMVKASAALDCARKLRRETDDEDDAAGDLGDFTRPSTAGMTI